MLRQLKDFIIHLFIVFHFRQGDWTLMAGKGMPLAGWGAEDGLEYARGEKCITNEWMVIHFYHKDELLDCFLPGVFSPCKTPVPLPS